MKRHSNLLLCALTGFSFVTAFTFGSAVFGDPARPHAFMTYRPVRPENHVSAPSGVAASVSPLPLWNYSVKAGTDIGGATFTGSIIGRSPYDNGKTTTTINTQIIPLVITITDAANTTVTYNPTVNDACVTGPGGPYTDVQVITGSPIFTNNVWTMNGVNVGNTQYIDAFQRAQFWSLVQGTPYHLILNASTLPSQTMTFKGTGVAGSLGPGTNYTATSVGGTCGSIGVVQIDDLDKAVQALITGPLAASVNAGTFPIFLTKNVVMTDGGVSIFSNCCILGFHSGFTVGPNLQIYSPFSLDTTGTFGGHDVSTLAHEMGEAINDPTIKNMTPVWGNIGQVGTGGQNNFEVGDPLSPGFGTPTNTFVVTGANGLTYHMQELAFFSWFFGGTSLGAGGKFSNNGTFGGNMKLNPPGGSN